MSKTVKHFPVPDDPALHQDIVDIVNDTSGGIKFVELITRLMTSDHGIAMYRTIDTDRFLYDVEYICRHSVVVKVLDYTYDQMHIHRAKMFVYTP
jgi:hypothetical protein